MLCKYLHVGKVYMYVSAGMYAYSIYVCVYLYTYICGCTHMCLYINVCDWLHVIAFRTRSDDPNSVTEDSELCPLWTRYTGNSKTDPWDDL